MLLFFDGSKYFHRTVNAVESDVVAVMDLLAGIAVSRKIRDTGASGVEDCGAALRVHRGENIANGPNTIILAVAEHIGPPQRTAAAGHYDDLTGKAISIMDVALFRHNTGLYIRTVPAHDAVGTDKGVTLDHGPPCGTAFDDLVLTHISGEPPNNR